MSRWYFEFSPAHAYLPPRSAKTGGATHMVIRREPFLAVGGFPEDWRMAVDVFALARFAVAGGSIRFEPEIVGRHVNVPGMRWMVRHVYHFGRWTAKVRRAYPHLSGGTAIKWPILSLGLWLARLGLLYVRVLTAQRGPRLSLLYHTPGILVALIAWNAGFTREAFRSSDKSTTY